MFGEQAIPIHKENSFFFYSALPPQKPYGLLGAGEGGGRGRLYTYRYTVSTRMTPALRWWKREIIYLSLHCHHQNDSCIKMVEEGDYIPIATMSPPE